MSLRTERVVRCASADCYASHSRQVGRLGDSDDAGWWDGRDIHLCPACKDALRSDEGAKG